MELPVEYVYRELAAVEGSVAFESKPDGGLIIRLTGA